MNERAKRPRRDAPKQKIMFGATETWRDKPPHARITVIEKKAGILSKSISLGPDGQPVSDSSGCFLAEGRRRRSR